MTSGPEGDIKVYFFTVKIYNKTDILILNIYFLQVHRKDFLRVFNQCYKDLQVFCMSYINL